MFLRKLLSVLLFISFATNVIADQTSNQVSQWRQAHEQQIVDQFAELLSIPDVASDIERRDARRDCLGVARHVHRV